MNGILSRKISDFTNERVRVHFSKPGIFTRHLGVESQHDGIVKFEKCRVSRRRFKNIAARFPQLLDRVVTARPPLGIIERPEHLTRIIVPTPPQIIGKLVQPADAPGKQKLSSFMVAWRFHMQRLSSKTLDFLVYVNCRFISNNTLRGFTIRISLICITDISEEDSGNG